MPVPRRIDRAWRLIALLEGSRAASGDPVAMRAEANRRRRLSRLPVARFVMGRLDPAAVVEDSFADLADGTTLGLRVYRPRTHAGGALPVIVNFHGGGWVSGDPRQSDWWCSAVSARAGVAVVSVDYRLAPEYPFPTGVEDAYAATCWVAERAVALGVDPERVAVMGDSAGGNLAAVVCQLARDRGGPAIRFQLLVYPAVDFVDDYPSEREWADAPVLTKVDMVRHRKLYISEDDHSEPRASPLRGRLDGLPPALVQTAECDPIRDQGIAYAKALRQAGVEVRATTYTDAVHGYLSIPGLVPRARDALAEAVEQVQRQLVDAPVQK